jgi:hypothetical protein
MLIGLAVAEGIAGVSLALVAVTVALSAVAGLTAVASVGGRDIDRWRRGAAGERRTAELLADLPARGWSVWHDLRVPGSAANIDHLVVGRTGVWVVDSKATRATVAAGWRSVRFGARKLDVTPTRWEADVVTDVLSDSLGEHSLVPGAVRPIVAVHGTGLRRRGARVGGVPVVPADQLTSRLRRGRRRLSRRQRRAVCLAVSHSFNRSDPG